MAAHKLSREKAASLLRDFKLGRSVKELAKKYGVTRESVIYWLPYAGLDSQWLPYLKNVEFKYKWLDRRHQHAKEQLRVSAEVIKNLVPSRKKRSLMSAAVRAKYGMERTSGNAIFGLGHAAGGSALKTKDSDTKLVAAMKEYLAENPGSGFERMLNSMLLHRSYVKYQMLRLYKENALDIKKKKQVSVPRRVSIPMEVQSEIDQVWSLDFMLDVLPSGNRFWILNVIDDFNRECVISQVSKRATAVGTVSALERQRLMGRKPLRLRSDNGGQFKSHAYLTWTDKNNIGRSYIRPSVSCDNALVERFNGTLRQEVTNRFVFNRLEDVQNMINDWRVRYNLSRPHAGLGGLSPMQFAYAAALKRGTSYMPCFT